MVRMLGWGVVADPCGMLASALSEANDVDNAGVLSPYGTMAQGGNVRDLMETSFDLANDSPTSDRIVRGSLWGDGADTMLSSHYHGVPPDAASDNTGFRVASSIPEPSAFVLAAFTLLGLVYARRRRPAEKT